MTVSQSKHINDTIKILWISDIHLREKYAKPPLLKKLKSFFESLVNKIIEEEYISPFNYILLTGDIAFAASEKEYQLFKTVFLHLLYEFYKDRPSSPQILTIAGNHDVSWNNKIPYEKYLTTYNNDEKTFKERNKYLNDNVTNIETSFINYSAAFGSANKTKLNNLFFRLTNNGHQEVHPKYKQKRLYGYFIDHDKKLIFLLLNTAWFSIGEKFNEHLVKSFITGNPLKKSYTKKILKNLLSQKDNIVEYGNQIIGSDLMDATDFEDKLIENPGYRVITSMHHPLNWLSWGELYNYNIDIQKKSTLTKILTKSDVLLTGHEHMPAYTPYEKIYDDTVHIKAGMLMEDELEVSRDKNSFIHSRFSILEMNADQMNLLTERRFLFNINSVLWEPTDQEAIELKIKDYRITRSKLTYIEDNIASFKVLPYIQQRKQEFVAKTKNGGSILPLVQKANFTVYKFECATECRYCIIILNSKFNFDEFLYSKTGFNTVIKTHIKGNLTQKESIHFFWPDVFIDDFLTTDFINPDSKTSSTSFYNTATKQCDLKFNNFRRKFFGDLQDGSKDSRVVKIDKKGLFKKIRNIQLINEVIPCWRIMQWIK